MRQFCNLRALIFALMIFVPQLAVAQTLPFHIDLSSREDSVDISSLPTIRFLTTADFPPFNYRDARGELVGFHIDLARAICDNLFIVCTVQSWPFEQVADALDEHQGDAMIAGLAIDPISAERFDFSDIYLGSPARFVTTKAGAADFDPAAENVSIAVRQGTAHQSFLKTYLPNAKIVPLESEAEALELITEGSVDAFFGDGLRAAFWLNAHPVCCQFSGEAYFRPDLFGQGYAVAVPAGRDMVRGAINAALTRLQRSGKLDELYLRWFPVSYY